MKFYVWWAVLLVAGTAVLYVAANALTPGPVVSLIVGAVWAIVAPCIAIAIAEDD